MLFRNRALREKQHRPPSHIENVASAYQLAIALRGNYSNYIDARVRAKNLLPRQA